jgi:hypothetical protein
MNRVRSDVMYGGGEVPGDSPGAGAAFLPPGPVLAGDPALPKCQRLIRPLSLDAYPTIPPHIDEPTQLTYDCNHHRMSTMRRPEAY